MVKTQMTPAIIMSTLELDPKAWPFHSPLLSAAHAEELLDKFKEHVKKQRRILAKKYHPDVSKDPEEGLERLKEINAMVEFVMRLRVNIQPRPVCVRYTHYSSIYTSTASWISSTTCSW